MTTPSFTDTVATPVRQPPRTTRILLACGVVAGPLFVLTFLVDGATRADYDPLRHPVSSLALGDHGWTQTANFIIAGSLGVAFAIGLRRALQPGRASTWGPLLIGAFAIGLLGAGIFVTDPVNGYPPGTSDILTTYSTNGRLHDMFSLPVFVAPPVFCFVFTRRYASLGERATAIYSAATAVVFMAAFALTNVALNQNASLVDLAGLFQRITLVTGWTWLTVLAIHTLNPPVRPTRMS